VFTVLLIMAQVPYPVVPVACVMLFPQILISLTSAVKGNHSPDQLYTTHVAPFCLGGALIGSHVEVPLTTLLWILCAALFFVGLKMSFQCYFVKPDPDQVPSHRQRFLDRYHRAQKSPLCGGSLCSMDSLAEFEIVLDNKRKLISTNAMSQPIVDQEFIPRKHRAWRPRHVAFLLAMSAFTIVPGLLQLRYIPPDLACYIGGGICFIIGLFLRLYYARQTSRDVFANVDELPPKICLLAGAIGGLLSGILGVGGGLAFGPIILRRLQGPRGKSTATALALLTLTAVISQYTAMRKLDIVQSQKEIISATIASFLGALISRYTASFQELGIITCLVFFAFSSIAGYLALNPSPGITVLKQGSLIEITSVQWNEIGIVFFSFLLNLALGVRSGIRWLPQFQASTWILFRGISILVYIAISLLPLAVASLLYEQVRVQESFPADMVTPAVLMGSGFVVLSDSMKYSYYQSSDCRTYYGCCYRCGAFLSEIIFYFALCCGSWGEVNDLAIGVVLGSLVLACASGDTLSSEGLKRWPLEALVATVGVVNFARGFLTLTKPVKSEHMVSIKA